jgi:hypothetical protein
MENNKESREPSERLREDKLVLLTRIIDELAGDKSNLKVSFQDFKLFIGKSKAELSGEVNFNMLTIETTEEKP